MLAQGQSVVSLLVKGAERMFGNIEGWFLSGNTDDFREERRYAMPMSLAKMRHPYTRLRLRPLIDEIRDRRTYLVISLFSQGFEFSSRGKKTAQDSRRASLVRGPGTRQHCGMGYWMRGRSLSGDTHASESVERGV